ncbi:DUF4190 domain-containing protein [Micromonospora sp. NPDC050397]|uniref:DUF4190 domain-containing protein n=1 Tax=Micromonospora sp. NPDC050397 TaxID=3364279 RepID=UPI00384F18B7
MSDPQQPGNWNAPPGSAPESPQSPAYQPPPGAPDPTAYQNPTGAPDPTAYQNPAGYQVPTGAPDPTAYAPDPTAYQNPTGYPQYPAGSPDPAAYQQYPAGAPDPAAYQQYQQAGYPAPAYPPGYGYPATPPQNGMAVASLVVSIVGVLGLCGYGLGGYLGIVGAILGHVAKRQIRERGESGGGMATAGIIIGWIAAGIAVLATIAIIIFFVYVAQNPDVFDSSTTY